MWQWALDNCNNLCALAEDWPGFDVPPIRNDSLWDTDYNPLDPHKTWNSPSEPPTTSTVSLVLTYNAERWSIVIPTNTSMLKVNQAATSSV